MSKIVFYTQGDSVANFAAAAREVLEADFNAMFGSSKPKSITLLQDDKPLTKGIRITVENVADGE